MWPLVTRALFLISLFCNHIAAPPLRNGTGTTNASANDSKLPPHAHQRSTMGNQDSSSDEGTPWGIIAGCTVVAVIVCILVGALIFVLYRRRKIRRDSLHRTLNDQTSTVVSLAKLKIQAAEVIGSVDAAEEIVSMIADEASEKNDIDEHKIAAMKVPVRYGFVELRAETAVLLDKKRSQRIVDGNIKLHMSKMYDYYGQPAIICQAPLPNQFTDQWKAIWQEKVGLIVWVGMLTEKGEKKIEPYIPLKERKKMTFGNFVIQTIAVAKSPHEYDQYLVRVYKTRENARPHTHSRNLIFVHAHFWPDHSSPMVPAKLADFVERLNDHHTDCALRGLAAIMIHCSAGVQRSPALMAAYIGRQMWEAEHKINLLGILRYVRRYRYKAFELGNAALQVQIVYGVIQILATRIELQSKTGVKRQRKHHLDLFEERVQSYVGKISKSGSGSSTSSRSA